MDNFNDLVKYLNPLLKNLSAGEMTKLNKKVGADLRRSQQKRISQQQNPDGSNYAPRRLRRGNRIRRKMFTKLKANRYLRNFSNDKKISISFLQGAYEVARIHQFGWSVYIGKKGSRVTYPKRELLGFSHADVEMIEQSVLKHLDVMGK